MNSNSSMEALRLKYGEEGLDHNNLHSDPLMQFQTWYQQANFGSRKSKQMAENNQVSLIFPWISLHRQVIIEGSAEKISTAESMKYFATRPRGSQLGAWSSHQSEVLSTRSMLEAKMNEIKNKFAHGEIPLPSFWGGYRVKPTRIEFWQGRQHRLHDRFLFTLTTEKTWKVERLAP
jgi:pyridoxamine 5'-phosphate oxidase